LTLDVVGLLLAKYVRGMPTTGDDLALELGCVAVGSALRCRETGSHQGRT
jgi:hypothetical protein